MKLKAGIVGLPNVGKSTLFNALTGGATAQAAKYVHLFSQGGWEGGREGGRNWEFDTHAFAFLHYSVTGQLPFLHHRAKRWHRRGKKT